MRQRNSAFGLFITLCIIMIILSFFSTIIFYFLPFIILIGLVVFAYQIIRAFFGMNRQGRQDQSRSTYTTTSDNQGENTQTNHVNKKESIDVEYTVVDETENE